MNTAARLQAAAPVDGVLVDEATFRATNRAIVYREHPPVPAKGKAEPVTAAEAVEPRVALGIDLGGGADPARRRDARARRCSSARWRGPRREGAAARHARRRARDRQEPAGRELWQGVDDDPELISWRQGRCLPYGDGVAFWGLAEIVKAQAGILETDGVDEAQ